MPHCQKLYVQSYRHRPPGGRTWRTTAAHGGTNRGLDGPTPQPEPTRTNGGVPTDLRIGIRRRPCLSLDYHLCRLSDLNALDYMDSANIAARIVLPNMRHPRERRVDVCLSAIEGLGALEPDPHLPDEDGHVSDQPDRRRDEFHRHLYL